MENKEKNMENISYTLEEFLSANGKAPKISEKGVFNKSAQKALTNTKIENFKYFTSRQIKMLKTCEELKKEVFDIFDKNGIEYIEFQKAIEQKEKTVKA